MRRAFTLAFVMLVLPMQPAPAQTGDGHARPQRGKQAAVEFRVKHFTAADGLPSNDVYSIEEDSLGFLWLGTTNGLVRYDGYTFTSFLTRPNDSTSIGGRAIGALHVDATGHLWVGSPDGLSRFDHEQEQFRRYWHDPEEPGSLIYDAVTSITSSPADPGVIWIGTSGWPTGQGGGLSRLDVTTGTFINYRHEPQEPGSLRSNLISCLLVGRDGTLWVGTSGGGLQRFDPATDSFTAFLPQPTSTPEAWINVVAIYEDREGVLWVGTQGGLQRFDPERGSFTSFFPNSADPNDLRNHVHAIFEDRAGTLWIGTHGGLNRFDRHTGHFTRFRHQPSPPDIWSIHEDRFGVLWIGSSGGLMKLERWTNPFTIYRHDPEDPNSLAEDAVRPIYEDSQGILWVGTRRQLNRVDRSTGSVTRYAHDPEDPSSLSAVEITSIYGDRAGTLWVAGCRGGLNRMDAERPGRFTRFQHDPDDPSSIGPGCVNPPLEDRAGNFWIALWGGGIDRMDRERGTFRHYTRASHGLGDDGVLVLYEAPSEPGTLWVGTSQGVSRFDTKTEHFTNYHAENLRRTTMLHEDRAGRFWVATASSGLHLFDRQKGTSQAVYTTEEGLSNNVVKSILEDDQGYLWLGTSNGLSKFDPERRTFQNYDARDGLPGNLFHEGAHGKSASGELFFGGANGMVSFFPEEVVDSSAPPEVVLTGLQIAGAPVEIGPGSPLERSILVTESVVLSHEQNELTLEYVGLHSIDPAQHRYRYRLEGYDREWVEAGVQRTARYARLPPGEYVFRVRAANSGGVWNEEGASLRITVLPPWWRTWWAYMLYVLLFAAAVFAVDRTQRRRLIRRERERAEREAEKLRAEAAEHLANYLQSENERQTQELEQARQLQLSMLPEKVPEHPVVEIAAFMQTATEVGGDYYDFHLSGDGTLTFAIGDATGHGVQAGTMVTAMKSLFMNYVDEPDIAEVLHRSARTLRRMHLPRLYMALALGKLRDHTLELAGAGMPPALVYRAASGCIEQVPLKGLPLGSPGVFPYSRHRVKLSAGDTVLLMSDGFPELFGEAGEMLGYERAVEVFAEVAEGKPEEVTRHLRERAKAWCNGQGPGDDMTFLVMQVKGAATMVPERLSQRR